MRLRPGRVLSYGTDRGPFDLDTWADHDPVRVAYGGPVVSADDAETCFTRADAWEAAGKPSPDAEGWPTVDSSLDNITAPG